MVDVMISAPGGFMNAAATVNDLPEDVLAELCQMVLKFIQHDTGTIDTAALYNKCQSAGCACTQESVQSAANVITYIYRTASRGCLGADELSSQLRGSSTWSEQTVATIIQFWQQQSESSELRSHRVNTGKGKNVCVLYFPPYDSDVTADALLLHLVDLQWKLGVSVSSNTCKNLNSPFVTMTIKVAEPSGQLTTQSLEMTIVQFQNFSKQLKEMASVLDTV